MLIKVYPIFLLSVIVLYRVVSFLPIFVMCTWMTSFKLGVLMREHVRIGSARCAIIYVYVYNACSMNMRPTPLLMYIAEIRPVYNCCMFFSFLFVKNTILNNLNKFMPLYNNDIFETLHCANVKLFLVKLTYLIKFDTKWPWHRHWSWNTQ